MKKWNFPMKKSHVIFLVVFVVAFVGLKLWQYHWPEADIVVDGERLHVEVARTDYHKQKGLGGRSSMGDVDGMIFLFDLPGQHGIVMRDMEFPIDIVWVDHGAIVDIAPSVPVEPGVPEGQLRRYIPRIKANVVLELPAGWAEAHELEIGDRVEIAR